MQKGCRRNQADFQLEAGSERRVNDIGLASGIDQKIKRTGIADHHWNYQQAVRDEPRMQGGNVRGTVSFGLAQSGRELQSGGEKDPDRSAKKWGFHVDLRSRGASRRRHGRLYLATSMDWG
jgi:hypothetical protein